ncbi:MAG: hypothetical protein IPM96_11640 [Ignavibacteria bacterium]|nr:hypothetical protein [Ignavibacteria bacterium]
METITRKIKRNGRNKITIELPEDFIAENIEVTIKADEKEELKNNSKKISLAEEAFEYYKDIRVDLNNYKFDRDELHDSSLKTSLNINNLKYD